MIPFSISPAVKSPATTCTTTTEQDELIGEIKVFLEENLVDENQLEFKELLDHFCVNQKKTKKPLKGILKRRESKPTAAATATNDDEFPGRSSPTRRKLPKSQETTFSKGLTLTKEQDELIAEIRVFLEEALADEIQLECKELLVQDFFDEKRTKKPLRGILKKDVFDEKRTNEPLRGILKKKKKVVLRKGLK